MNEFSPSIGNVGKGIAASALAAAKYLIVPILVLTALTTLLARVDETSIISDQIDLERIRFYVLVLGVPITALAFFRGFYPKGTLSRFAFAAAITALACVWIWEVMMAGNITLELEGFGFSLSYVGLVMLFILGAALGGVYYLVEMLSYRREWLASREAPAVPPSNGAR